MLILEQGPAICALSDVFEDFFQRYPENNVLKKWIIDVATKGAEKVFFEHNVQVSPPD